MTDANGRPSWLTAEAERTITDLAERHGEKPRAILREMRRGTPTARLLLKLAGLDAPAVAHGRAPDENRFKTIVQVVRDLEREMGRAEAIKAAPQRLHAMGISGPSGRPLSRKRLYENLERIDRVWFDASALQKD